MTSSAASAVATPHLPSTQPQRHPSYRTHGLGFHRRRPSSRPLQHLADNHLDGDDVQEHPRRQVPWRRLYPGALRVAVSSRLHSFAWKNWSVLDPTLVLLRVLPYVGLNIIQVSGVVPHHLWSSKIQSFLCHAQRTKILLGTTGSIENLAVANIVSPQPEQVLEEQVEEKNDDVVSFGNLGCAILTTIPLHVSCALQIDHCI